MNEMIIPIPEKNYDFIRDYLNRNFVYRGHNQKVLRKASAYSKKNVTPFTRKSKTRNKNFIKAIPPQKIVKFEMGKYSDKLKHRLTMVAIEKVQIRHNALESCRQFVNKIMDEELMG